ncbi:chymotrypsin inhibitor-like [Cochliomyia hominivorax]
MFKSRKYLLMFAIVFLVVMTTKGDEECGENEVWTECGANCPLKCNEEPEPCDLACNSGCRCIPGYLVNSDGKCVAAEEC